MRDHDLLYRIGTHPLRKMILITLSLAPRTIEEISEGVGIEKERLGFHMDMLLHSKLVELKNNAYALTEDGRGFAEKVLSS
jgi:predicted transcriptional regulator